MGEIGERYVEQIVTTLETMRRRLVAYYDGVFFIGRKVEKAVERLKEVAEPAAYDTRDYLVTSCSSNDPLETIDAETKNTFVEMYLGISVILIGLAGGELSGAIALAPIIEYMFNGYVEWILITILPAFVFFNIRKNVSLDDQERRTMLFANCLLFGIISGHLMGARLLSLAPSVLFIGPLLFALLFDNGLIVTNLTVIGRQTFFYIFAAAALVVSTIIASFVVGYFSFAILLFNILHIAGLFVHFQIICQFAKDKMFMVGESQMAYIGSVLFVQIIWALLFGISAEPVEVVQSASE